MLRLPPHPTCLPRDCIGLGQGTRERTRRLHSGRGEARAQAVSRVRGFHSGRSSFALSLTLFRLSPLPLPFTHTCPPFTVLPPDSRRRRDIYSRPLPARHHRRSLDPLPCQLALPQL